MKPEFLLGLLASPIFGAMIGFGIAIVSLRFWDRPETSARVRTFRVQRIGFR